MCELMVKKKRKPSSQNALAPRYGSLASVLVKFDEQLHGPATFGRDQPPPVTNQLAELLAEVAFVKAENQRLVERFTDELKRLTERLAELEARAHRSWWARMFGSPGRGPEPARQPRRQAVARLRALCLDEEVEYRPT
jgi:uncharacterized coiled-coil protein SlyX